VYPAYRFPPSAISVALSASRPPWLIHAVDGDEFVGVGQRLDNSQWVLSWNATLVSGDSFEYVSPGFGTDTAAFDAASELVGAVYQAWTFPPQVWAGEAFNFALRAMCSEKTNGVT